MRLYPAIDIRAGSVVRLTRGDFSQETIYRSSPLAQAREFAAMGCEWIHVVDLDGASLGRSVNGAHIREIVEKTSLKVQLGGGIRSAADVSHWLDAGVARVIIGTLAVQDPDETQRILEKDGKRIAIGLDGRDGKVAIKGWQEQSLLGVEELAGRYHPAPACFIHTDIARDGMGTGINAVASLSLARSVGVPVIASGGVSSLDDVHLLLSLGEPLLEGMIVGRAYYEGHFDIEAALLMMEDASKP